MRISEIAEFWSSVSSNWKPEQNLFHEKYSFLWTVPFIKYLFAAIEIKEWAISLILSLAFDLLCCQERVPNLSISPTSWPYFERRLRFSIGKNNLSLSGGQVQRLALARVFYESKPIIILDEPTNHLDMESIEALNHALNIFEGTVIFVSHDREFISSLSTRLIEVKKETVIEHSGGYEGYRNLINEVV